MLSAVLLHAYPVYVLKVVVRGVWMGRSRLFHMTFYIVGLGIAWTFLNVFTSTVWFSCSRNLCRHVQFNPRTYVVMQHCNFRSWYFKDFTYYMVDIFDYKDFLFLKGRIMRWRQRSQPHCTLESGLWWQHWIQHEVNLLEITVWNNFSYAYRAMFSLPPSSQHAILSYDFTLTTTVNVWPAMGN